MNASRIHLKVMTMILTLAIVLPFASFGATPSKPGEITATGFLKKQGITTYMYGTHVLLDDNGWTLYALRSNAIDLNKYINLKVTVRGSLIDGYPLDFGPNYLNVKSME